MGTKFYSLQIKCGTLYVNHFAKVSWWLDKNCGFSTNGQFLPVYTFFTQTLFCRKKMFRNFTSSTPPFHDHLAPNSVRLEVIKKVLLVHLPQGAAKLHINKVLALEKMGCFHMTIWYMKKKVIFEKWKNFWQLATLQPLEANG